MKGEGDVRVVLFLERGEDGVVGQAGLECDFPAVWNTCSGFGTKVRLSLEFTGKHVEERVPQKDGAL